jgi:DNA-binding PadR family transcriptional regulator
MSSPIRLLVLGVVRIFQPIHGYDIRRELLSWHADEWGSVAPGSIYNAIKTLTREGFLSVSGTAQIGARPERTSYQLTDAGTREHLRLLRDSWRQVRVPIDPLMPALAFMPMLPRAEVLAHLRERMLQIERMLTEARWAQRHLVASAPRRAPDDEHQIPRHPDGSIDFDDDFKPEHVYETFALLIARVGSELEWSRALIARLEQGRYQMADEAGAADHRPTAPRAKATAAPRGKKPASAPAPAKNALRRSSSSRPKRR